MLPTELQFTCPNCRDSFDASLVNGIAEFQCFGCRQHYRVVVATDVEPGDFEVYENTEVIDGVRYSRLDSLPQEVNLSITTTKLKDESEYYARPN